MNGNDSVKNVCRIVVEYGYVKSVHPIRLRIYIGGVGNGVSVDNKCVDMVCDDNLVATFDVADFKLKVVVDSDGIGYLRREDARFHQALLSGLLSNASIDEMADICCLSVSTFKRRFRRRYSASPHDWFLQQRLHIAYQLLLASNLHVCELASFCGFRNVSHFIAQFRRHYDITPSCLRHSIYKSEDDNSDIAPKDIIVDIEV